MLSYYYYNPMLVRCLGINKNPSSNLAFNFHSMCLRFGSGPVSDLMGLVDYPNVFTCFVSHLDEFGYFCPVVSVWSCVCVT